MRYQKGKVNLTSILIVLVLVYGAFVAFKVIASKINKSQIKNEIIEKFGFIRGTEFTPEKGEQVILEILKEHDLYHDEYEQLNEEDEYSSDSGDDPEGGQESLEPIIDVEIRQKGSRIWFSVEYVDIIKLLLFKIKSRYYIEDEMLNYN